MAGSDLPNDESYEQRQMFCPSVHVRHTSVDSHGEASGFQSPAHEVRPVPPEESLACPRVPGQEDIPSQIYLSLLAVVAGR